MSGICGIFNFKQEGVDKIYLTRMCDAIRHRGPDGEGEYFGFEIDEEIFKVGLGYRELSISGSSHNHQPIHNEDKTLWLGCDGQIYNYNELKDTCQKKGHKFYTQSTPEVIIHLYEDYGFDCLKNIRGTFAFAIWDSNRKIFFLARDHIGTKPLYYTFHNNSFIFASEVKAILSDANIKRTVSWEAFSNYLTFLSIPAPLTLFEGIYKLEPGYRMVISENASFRKEEYWDIFSNKDEVSLGSESDYIHYIQHSLDEVMRFYSADNTDSGVFLSGGLDSSLITALLSRHRKGIKTFTTGFKNGDVYNEFKYARTISNLFNTKHCEILLNEDDFNDAILRKIVYCLEEPVWPGCIPYYRSAESARAKGIAVSYTGEGGDELFLGYPYWQKMLKFKKYLDGFSNTPSFLRLGLLNIFAILLGKNSFRYEMLRKAHEKETLFWGSFENFSQFEKDILLNKELKDTFSSQASSEIVHKYYRKFIETSPSKDYGHFMSYFDLKIKVPELFIMRMDKMAMANSLEVRTPFLDYKFVERAMIIPQGLKLKKGIAKYILKKATESIIPNELIYRKKKGWGAMAVGWYFDTTQEMGVVKAKITSFTNQTGLFNSGYIRWLLQRDKTLRDKIKLWQLFSFIIWHEEWIEKK